MSNIILGIDPGYDRLGWAIVNYDQKNPSVKLACIETNRQLNLFDRYQQIARELQIIIENYSPSIAVIESLFFFKNQKTALKVAEARGVEISILLSNHLKIFEYTPLQIKETVTGYGRASKKAVEKMLRLEFKTLEINILDDALDALAIVLTHHIRSKNLIK